MRIERTIAAGRAAPSKFARRGQASFGMLLAAEQGGEAACVAAAGAAPVDAGAPLPPPPDDAMAERHGHRMVDLLRDLQVAMIRGEAGAAVRALAAEAARAPPAGDDRLAAVLGELRLRAAVEVAKQDVVAGAGC